MRYGMDTVMSVMSSIMIETALTHCYYETKNQSHAQWPHMMIIFQVSVRDKHVSSQMNLKNGVKDTR